MSPVRWMGRSSASALALLLALLSGSCEEITATQVMVYLDAAPAMRMRAARLTVDVLNTEGAAQGPWEFVLESGFEPPFPFRIPLVPRDGDAQRRWHLVAELHDETGELIARQRAIGGYVADELREVRLFFSSPCDRVLCGSPRTCFEGRCVDSCVTPAPAETGTRSLFSECSPEGSSVFDPVLIQDGGSVDELVVAPGNPEVAFVRVDDNRLYRTSDGADSWTRCPINYGDLDAVAVSPEAPFHLWITADGRVMKSTDGCDTFAPAGLAEEANALLAVADDRLVAGSETGIFLFADGGWETIASPLDFHSVRVFAASADASHIYAGSNTGGIARSVDGGQTWTGANAGLTSLEIRDLSVDAGDPTRVFAQTDDGLHRSLDAGDTWLKLLNEGRSTVAVDPTDPAVVVSGGWDHLRASFDGGDTFGGTELRSNNMQGGSVRRVRYAADGRLYAAASRGVFVQSGRDFDWEAAHTGINAWEVSDVVCEPERGAILLATPAGALRSVDGGQSWVPRFSGIVNVSGLSQIVTDGPDRILAVGSDLSLSEDAGASFRRIYFAHINDGFTVTSVAIAGDAIYAGTRTRFVEALDGATFTTIALGGADRRSTDVLVTEGEVRRVWVTTLDGVYVRADGESEFTERSDGLLTHEPSEIAEEADGDVLVGTDGGLFAWDGESSWATDGLEGREVRDLLTLEDLTVVVTSDSVFFRRIGEDAFQELPGMRDLSPRAAGTDCERRLLIGTGGDGLWATPLP